MYKLISFLIFTPLAIYCFGIIYFDGPFTPRGYENLGLALVWSALTLTASITLRNKRLSKLIVPGALVIVLTPWLMIQPSNEREWQPEFAQTGSVSINEDVATFHNYRNFDYTIEGTITERWEDKTVQLSNLKGIDFFLDRFGGDKLAHPIASFDFGEDGHVCLSIETRREQDESFSALGGLFKMFELQYIFGSEEDLIRVRTNIRKEPVFLYRLKTKPGREMEILMESIASQNALKKHPRFYNVITSNCTTSLRAQTPSNLRQELDIRMLLNGMLDELVYELGGLESEQLSFDALSQQALINEAAIESHSDPQFSERIRNNRIGFQQ